MSQVLIDTSVWLDYLSNRPKIDPDQMDAVLFEGNAVTCQAIHCELQSSLEKDQPKKVWENLFDHIPFIDLNWDSDLVWKKLAGIGQSSSKKKTSAPSLTERMILLCAGHRGAKIWTLDKEFLNVIPTKMTY